MFFCAQAQGLGPEGRRSSHSSPWGLRLRRACGTTHPAERVSWPASTGCPASTGNSEGRRGWRSWQAACMCSLVGCPTQVGCPSRWATCAVRRNTTSVKEVHDWLTKRIKRAARATRAAPQATTTISGLLPAPFFYSLCFPCKLLAAFPAFLSLSLDGGWILRPRAESTTFDTFDTVPCLVGINYCQLNLKLYPFSTPHPAAKRISECFGSS